MTPWLARPHPSTMIARLSSCHVNIGISCWYRLQHLHPRPQWPLLQSPSLLDWLQPYGTRALDSSVVMHHSSLQHRWYAFNTGGILYHGINYILCDDYLPLHFYRPTLDMDYFMCEIVQRWYVCHETFCAVTIVYGFHLGSDYLRVRQFYISAGEFIFG